MDFVVSFELVFIEGYLKKADFDYSYNVYLSVKKSLPNFCDETFSKQLSQFKSFIDEAVEKCKVPVLDDRYFLLTFSQYNAVCLFLGEYSLIVSDNNPYDFQYFQHKKIKDEYIKYATFLLMKYSKNCSILVFWPSTNRFKNGRNKGIDLVKNNFDVVYAMSVRFSFCAFYQFLFILYYNSGRSKNALNTYSEGFVDKVYKCYKSGRECLFLFIFNNSSEELLNLKRGELRNIFGIGYHSVHSCDDKNESLPIARQLLNKNSFYILQKGNFGVNADLTCKLLEFHANDNVCFSESTFYALLGKKTEERYIFFDKAIEKNWESEAFFNHCKLSVPKRKRFFCFRKYNYCLYLIHYSYVKLRNKIIRMLKGL